MEQRGLWLCQLGIGTTEQNALNENADKVVRDIATRRTQERLHRLDVGDVGHRQSLEDNAEGCLEGVGVLHHRQAQLGQELLPWHSPEGVRPFGSRGSAAAGHEVQQDGEDKRQLRRSGRGVAETTAETDTHVGEKLLRHVRDRGERSDDDEGTGDGVGVFVLQRGVDGREDDAEMTLGEGVVVVRRRVRAAALAHSNADGCPNGNQRVRNRTLLNGVAQHCRDDLEHALVGRRALDERLAGERCAFAGVGLEETPERKVANGQRLENTYKVEVLVVRKYAPEHGVGVVLVDLEGVQEVLKRLQRGLLQEVRRDERQEGFDLVVQGRLGGGLHRGAVNLDRVGRKKRLCELCEMTV
eukprot:PhM_4_TR1284/c1_g1_i1/m.7163